MIVIIVFVAVIVWIFRYNYLRISDAECRKNIIDGYLYKDGFGNLRLLKDGKRVYYKKNYLGQTYLCYGNGTPVDQEYLTKEFSRHLGKKDYICNHKYGINIFKNIETNEEYAKALWGSRTYHIEYSENKPMRIIDEDDISKGKDDYGEQIDWIRMNQVFKEMFEEKIGLCGNYYFHMAYSKYKRGDYRL